VQVLDILQLVAQPWARQHAVCRQQNKNNKL
jgi:hypothetical protein